MVQVNLDCRNFKCPSSSGGECRAANVTLTPVGGVIDRLICVECEEPEAKEDDTVTVPDTPDPNPDE